MVGLMHFVRDIADRPVYEFVDAERRRRAADSFQRGIRCILRCQIMVDGRLTAWCAQHDEQNFEPRARTFELASLSGAESVDIVRLLMSLPNPSPEVVQAIESAGIWFQSAKLSGIEQVWQPDANSPTGKNKVVLNNPAAPPLWALLRNRHESAHLQRPRRCAAQRAIADLVRATQRLRLAGRFPGRVARARVSGVERKTRQVAHGAARHYGLRPDARRPGVFCSPGRSDYRLFAHGRAVGSSLSAGRWRPRP